MSESDPLPLKHSPDMFRRFVVFDMFNTLVKLRDDIGKYEILDVLHRTYLSDHDYGRVRELYDEKVDMLIEERRPYSLEVVFIEILEHIFSGLGIIDHHDLAHIESEVFHGSGFVTHMEGASETLGFFKENGYSIGVLSNSYFLESTLDSCLKMLGLRDYIDVLVSSADILYMKPRKEAYDIVLERLGASPEDTFFIGDDPVNDYDGPSSHGMCPIHIALKDDVRPRHVDNIGDVPSLFKE